MPKDSPPSDRIGRMLPWLPTAAALVGLVLTQIALFGGRTSGRDRVIVALVALAAAVWLNPPLWRWMGAHTQWWARPLRISLLLGTPFAAVLALGVASNGLEGVAKSVSRFDPSKALRKLGDLRPSCADTRFDDEKWTQCNNPGPWARGLDLRAPADRTVRVGLLKYPAAQQRKGTLLVLHDVFSASHALLDVVARASLQQRNQYDIVGFALPPAAIAPADGDDLAPAECPAFGATLRTRQPPQTGPEFDKTLAALRLDVAECLADEDDYIAHARAIVRAEAIERVRIAQKEERLFLLTLDDDRMQASVYAERFQGRATLLENLDDLSSASASESGSSASGAPDPPSAPGRRPWDPPAQVTVEYIVQAPTADVDERAAVNTLNRIVDWGLERRAPLLVERGPAGLVEALAPLYGTRAPGQLTPEEWRELLAGDRRKKKGHVRERLFAAVLADAEGPGFDALTALARRTWRTDAKTADILRFAARCRGAQTASIRASKARRVVELGVAAPVPWCSLF